MQDLDPGIGGATPRHPVLRVLLVEDDPAISEMYGLALRLSGYIVETATCAGAALEAAFKTVPDLVLLDMGLPDMPGVELLRALKSAPRTAQVPVAVLSNYSPGDIADPAVADRVVAYMVKAETTPREIVEAVGGLLDPSD
jgi:CheY-like chemotaxis protein